MGRDKGAIEVGGIPCATRVASALATVCETVWLVGGQPPASTPGRPAPDPEGPRCALRGLVAALGASQAEYLLVCATDQPFVSPAFLAALARAAPADAWVPRDAAGVHPLCARYRRAALLEPARRRLAGDALSVRGLLEQVETRWLEGDALGEADPEGGSLVNVNTPAELLRAERRLAALRGR